MNLPMTNLVGLSFSWGATGLGAALGIVAGDITLWLTWACMTSAIVTSIVIAYVNLRKKDKKHKK